MVLKKPQESVVQIGTVQQIQMAVPGAPVKPVQIAPANGNGHANGNGAEGIAKPEAEAAVAGD
jgi:hypothetical protein